MQQEVIRAPWTALIEPDWADELDTALAEPHAPLPERVQRWEPTDLGGLEFAMSRLAELRRKAREVSAHAAQWRGEVDRWESAQLARYERGIGFFTDALESYGRRHRARNPKEPTIYLPSGEIATTKPKTPKVSIVNKPAVVEWARAHLDAEQFAVAVKTTEEPQVSKLREVWTVEYGDVPVCDVCGRALSEVEGEADDRWYHTDPTLDEHRASPARAWVVRFDGAPVPGVYAELGEITATAKPAR